MDLNNDQDQRKLESIKHLSKSSTMYMMGLGLIATLATLPEPNNNVDSYIESANRLIRVGIISLIGFMFMYYILAGLAQEAIEHDNRYWWKVLFYWLDGVSYILSCMIFSLGKFYGTFKNLSVFVCQFNKLLVKCVIF